MLLFSSLFNFHLVTVEEVSSCGESEWMWGIMGMFCHLVVGNCFHFTQCVLDQQQTLTKVNIRSISTSFKNLCWCLHDAETGKNEFINWNKNEGYDFKLWCLPSVFHHSLTCRHVSHRRTTWRPGGRQQHAHRPLCWGTRLLPLARTKSLIKGKSISMLLTPRCFSSCFRAVMCWQLRAVSIHFTSLRCLAQRSYSFRIRKWELETSFTWPFLSCTQQTQLLYDYIFTQSREWEQFWTSFS